MENKSAAKRRVKLTKDEKLKIAKKLRDKYVKKYGYARKVIIDDVVNDFVAVNDFQIDPYKFTKLDKYMAARLKGVVTTDHMKFSYHHEVQKKRVEEEEALKRALFRKKFDRVCECDKDPQVVRSSGRSWSKRTPKEVKQVVEPEIPKEIRAAGYNRKSKYERKQ